VAEPLKPLADLYEDAEVRKPRNFTAYYISWAMGRNKAFPRTRSKVLHRKRKPLTTAIDAGNDRLDLLILLQDIFRMLDLLAPGNVRHMHEAIDAFLKLNECAKVGDVPDPAVNTRADGITLRDRI